MSAHVFHVMGAIISFMLIGTTVVGGIFLSSRERHRDMLVRTLSWYPVSLFFMGTIWLGRSWLIVAMAILSVRAFYELWRVTVPRFAPLLGIVSVVMILAQYALWGYGAWWLAMLWLPLMSAGILPALMMIVGRGDEYSARAGMLGFWVMLSGWSLGMIPAVCVMPLSLGAHGWQGALMFVLTITQLNDLFQYVWGKLLGRRLVAPEISPRKTWAGVVGGGATMTLIGAYLGGYIMPTGPLEGAILAAMMCVSGLIGDLLISSIKRDLGIKDLGQLLPGFGGVLDRVDSLLLNAPAFSIYVFLMYGPAGFGVVTL